MGEVLARAIFNGKLASPRTVVVVDSNFTRRKFFQRNLRVVTAAAVDLTSVTGKVVLLAVKPQQFESLARQLRGCLRPGQLVVSIMAGVSLRTLQRQLGFRKVIRSMPNIAAQAGAGMTVWYADSSVSRVQRQQAKKIFQAFGSELEVQREALVDAATAISGSGPAYLFYLAEMLEKNARKMGFSSTQASGLVRQTITGSATVYRNSALGPNQLRSKVTSKGGTTEAALQMLNKHKSDVVWSRALKAAYQRSQQIRKKYEQ